MWLTGMRAEDKIEKVATQQWQLPVQARGLNWQQPPPPKLSENWTFFAHPRVPWSTAPRALDAHLEALGMGYFIWDSYSAQPAVLHSSAARARSPPQSTQTHLGVALRRRLCCSKAVVRRLKAWATS